MTELIYLELVRFLHVREEGKKKKKQGKKEKPKKREEGRET